MRHLAPLIAIGLVVACAAPAAAATAGPLRVSADNPRYFADASGQPVFLTGMHTWANLQDRGDAWPPPAFDYGGYLDRLQALHHDCIRLWAWENPRWAPWTAGDWHVDPMPFARTGPGTALDGGARFDCTQFDQPYFDRLRARVIAARDRGIYVSVMLFQGWSIENKQGSGNPWPSHPFNRANNVNGIDGDPNGDDQGTECFTLDVPAVNAAQKAYMRKVVDTIGDLDNVLYEIANEGGSYSIDWQYDMIRAVKSYEASRGVAHPVGMTYPWPAGGNDVLWNSPADWIAPGNDDAYKSDPPAGTGAKVVVADTDHIWGMGGDDVWAWKSFTRGLNTFFMDDLADLGPSDYRTKARRAMGQTADYARRLALRTDTPRGDLASTGYCLATPGSEYLVYQPSGGGFSVDLSASTATYAVEWFSPDAGATQSGGTASGGAWTGFTPPFAGTAVLFLTATSVPPPPPGPIGIDLAGPAITIEGNAWRSYATALAFGLSVANATTWNGSYSSPLTPTPDADTLAMLSSELYRPGSSPGVGFSLAQTVANGSYDVYVWTIENWQAHARDMDLRLEGRTVATAIGDLPMDTWQKYGPYRVTVGDGVLNLDCLQHSKGDPALAGVLIVPVTDGGGGGASPYGGTPRAIPGRVEAEDFDDGGEGVAYHDSDAGNDGGGYRATDVDIRACVDAGGGWQVGWCGGGEWLQYTVSVADAGTYAARVRVASGASGATLHLTLDGADVSGPLSFGGTGSWDTWTDVSANVQLPAGTHALRLVIDSGALDINYLEFSSGQAQAPAVAVDLAGPAVTIEGQRWSSFDDALANGLTASGGQTWNGSYTATLTPAADADTVQMLASEYYRAQPPDGQGFTLSQRIADGTYDVCVWTIENWGDNARAMDLYLEGQLVASAIGDQPLWHWTKNGPYRVTVSGGALDLAVLKHGKGDPALAGFTVTPVTVAAVAAAAPDAAPAHAASGSGGCGRGVGMSAIALTLLLTGARRRR